MNDIMGNNPKKLLELVLAVVAVVLFFMSKETRGVDFIAVCVVLGYLALIVVMACMGRDLGANAAIEAAGGFYLTVFGLNTLLNGSVSDTSLIAHILSMILGMLLLIFLLF